MVGNCIRLLGGSIRKHHGLRDTEIYRIYRNKQKFIFLQLCKLETPDQCVVRVVFFWGSSPWLVDHHLFLCRHTVTAWLYPVPLNCALKDGLKGEFYVMCLFTTIKNCHFLKSQWKILWVGDTDYPKRGRTVHSNRKSMRRMCLETTELRRIGMR